ncbi:MAG: hypothetical protein EZS28_009401 [Streblomastix strix]|uniref:Uncharacterized protein n=1 Tax=Streblomastix strix TaxID=222440 RepID=A0A5J4WKK6_9EUKA|nr:MAG: hypothetical protein EZS28_009401 [Streblomastix strix]
MKKEIFKDDIEEDKDDNSFDTEQLIQEFLLIRKTQSNSQKRKRIIQEEIERQLKGKDEKTNNLTKKLTLKQLKMQIFIVFHSCLIDLQVLGLIGPARRAVNKLQLCKVDVWDEHRADKNAQQHSVKLLK